MREARRLVDDYLSSPTDTGRGNVIAVTGEYGIGKTHLAADLVRHIDATARSATHTISVEASVGDFSALHRVFVSSGS